MPRGLFVFREKKPGAAAAALREIDCPVLGRALTRLLARARAAKCPEGRLLVESYAGMATASGAYGRMHDPDGHLFGRGGSRKFWLWLTSPVIKKHFYFFHRLLARPAHARAANQLEITVAQLASVAINEMVCGPFPGPSDALMGFLKMCAATVGDLTVAQARRRVLRQKTTLPLPPRGRRRLHSSEARAQILVDADIVNQDPRGVEALAKFAESDTAMGFDDIQAALPRDILSEFGKRGNATQAATRAAIRTEASLLDLEARFPVCVKGAAEHDSTAAFLRRDALAKAGPRRDAQERAVAAVAGVLDRAGVVDLSRHEDRDPKKALLSFDAQLAHDAAVIQLVEDSYSGGNAAALRAAWRAEALNASPKSFADLPLRRGKWTPEEQNFYEVLVQTFLAGLVPDCADGTTLRAFLSRRLHCAPMRITKKLAGATSGRSIFSRTGQLNADDAANFRRLESLFVRAEIPTPLPGRADALRAADGNAQPAARPARGAAPTQSALVASRTRAPSPTSDDAPPFGVRAEDVDALLLTEKPPSARGVGAVAAPAAAVPDADLEASIVKAEWPSSPPLPPRLAEADVDAWLASEMLSPTRAVAASVAVEGARASPTSVTAWCGIP